MTAAIDGESTRTDVNAVSGIAPLHAAHHVSWSSPTRAMVADVRDNDAGVAKRVAEETSERVSVSVALRSH